MAAGSLSFIPGSRRTSPWTYGRNKGQLRMRKACFLLHKTYGISREERVAGPPGRVLA